jgi:hypothetical protein
MLEKKISIAASKGCGAVSAAWSKNYLKSKCSNLAAEK